MKTVKTVTLYGYDNYNDRYFRIAVIESEGLANLLLPEIKKYYPAVFWTYGAGKKHLPKEEKLNHA